MGQSRKFGAMSGAVALSLASAAAAQDAVQWRVEDGGNGHWYQRTSAALPWGALQSWCESRGGHLATLVSASEGAWVKSALPVQEAFIGGFQDVSAPDYAEPLGGWRWVTNEPFQIIPSFMGTFDDCPGGSPGYCGCGPSGAQNVLFFSGCCGVIVDDVGDGLIQNCDSVARLGIVEWSADCNGDGIVDFGQIRDGLLDDANGNNIPDCCEQARSCSYQPVQWKASDGGNGHWYQLQLVNPVIGWTAAQSAAAAAGGHLATLTSVEENDFVFDRANVTMAYGGSPVVGPWLGGFRINDQWAWVTGEPWNFANWLPPNPDGPGVWGEDRVCLTASGGQWNDFNESGSQPGVATRAYILEWSADCNNDGIVDFGQIRDGSLEDANGNNIPDCCESGSPCNCPGDIVRDGLVNGIDLAAVLNNWGATGGGAIDADVNDDGIVNGADLSTVLGTWGPCE